MPEGWAFSLRIVELENMEKVTRMTEEGKYLTVDLEYGPQEFKEKGSRFISYLYPVNTVDGAEDILQKMRKKYYDSTHVCFAFRLGEGEGKEKYFRSSDDGEPSGTAGLPIYNEIKRKEYLDVLVAVVRYYGGTKLGTGGLARAYGRSARQVLDISKKKVVVMKEEISVLFPYQYTGEVMQAVNRYSLDMGNRSDTAAGANLTLAVPITLSENVIQFLTDRCAGKVTIQKKNRK